MLKPFYLCDLQSNHEMFVIGFISGCDLVGFHIDDYCLNFLDCCQRRLGCRVDRSRFLCELDGRTIHVKSLPIGIPYDQFAEMGRKAPKVLKEKDEHIILGVDRLDYTKGIHFHKVSIFRPESDYFGWN